jgi:hypothetical protein
MKKLLLSCAFILAVITVMAQSPRQMVLAEDFTSTLCTYCPGAANGLDDLLANGMYVAVVCSHSSGMGADPFVNTYSTARNTLYGVSAFPSVCFDATKGYVGGAHTGSLYLQYVPLYNYCDTIPGPVTMSMNVTNTGLAYTAVITLTKTDVISSTSNMLMFFVTQSNITYNWEGQTKLQHVNRLMVPDANGTAIDFTSGNTQTVTLNFTMDSSWPLKDCEFVACFQDMDAGQGIIPGTSGYAMREYKVYQTIKRGAIDLHPAFFADVNQIPLYGTINYTDSTYGGYIGVPTSYHWIFDGGTPDTSNEQNPSVGYLTPGYHNVTLIVNRGGQIDTVTKSAYVYVGNVGIRPLSQNAVSIFPNPVKDFMTITGNNMIKNITVYNVTGQIVIEQSVNAKTITINTTGLSAGIYYLKASLDNGIVTKKLIIQ